MSTFDSNRPRKKLPLVVLLAVIIVVGLGAAAYYFNLTPRLERQNPQILLPEAEVLGRAPVEIRVIDEGAGLRSLSATLVAGGVEHAIAAEELAEPAKERKIQLSLTKLQGVKEGPAVLRVSARDNSLFGGNTAVLEKTLTIDVTPPTIELIADDRYINFGGSGAIVYKAAADAVTSGVRVGEHFFPGFPGQVKGNPDHLVAFFAHPYNAPPDARAVVVATDKAGNTREMPLAYELKNVKFRKSTIAISDGFLQKKVAPLLKDAREENPKEIFLAVNDRLRKENEDKIAAITKKATPSILWRGAFAQLSNSKVEANFADERTYTYNNEAIDKAYHLGYDLSVTKRYPVEAANSGTVAFVGELGIYGNTVILDHGLGLFTLYSHLSSFEVKEGDSVTQRQILGKTGETGLAGGDHLHYGVYLHGMAVLPLEWWDGKWINDNILPKLGDHGAEATAQSQPASAAPASPKKRGR